VTSPQPCKFRKKTSESYPNCSFAASQCRASRARPKCGVATNHWLVDEIIAQLSNVLVVGRAREFARAGVAYGWDGAWGATLLIFAMALLGPRSRETSRPFGALRISTARCARARRDCCGAVAHCGPRVAGLAADAVQRSAHVEARLGRGHTFTLTSCHLRLTQPSHRRSQLFRSDFG